MQILVAVDKPKVLSALCLLFEQQPDTEVVAEVCDVAALIDVTRALQPDILLVDIELEGMRPQDAYVRRLRALCPGLKIVALVSRPEVAREAVCAGADGLVNMTDSPQQVLTIMEAVRHDSLPNKHRFAQEPLPAKVGH